jgi:hypothetical protein
MIYLALMVFSFGTWAKPYFDPSKVISSDLESDKIFVERIIPKPIGQKVLRTEVTWQEGENYSISGVFKENSGTAALYKSASKRDTLGSYKAELSLSTPQGQRTYYSSLGTGREFRRLVRTLAFRFPLPEASSDLRLKVFAENPDSGISEKVLEKEIVLENLSLITSQEVKVTQLREAQTTPSLKVNFYAEGYSADGEKRFLEAAKKAITVLEKNLPGHEHFEFYAVFSPSKTKLGNHVDRGDEVKIQDSFLGLYFPHWRKFGRWYHVVYPTSETKYRNSLAQVPYDYPIAIVDDSGYWGVGNYKELTAIPANNFQFGYLLLHEFGHFMGLNEEYEGGGPTELEFAPKIYEPWSQNITFHPEPEKIKWLSHLSPGIALPTSRQEYNRHGGSRVNPVGAYRGGYADSEPVGKSHKPVLKCMMASGGDFCPVCKHALQELIKIDTGEGVVKH